MSYKIQSKNRRLLKGVVGFIAFFAIISVLFVLALGYQKRSEESHKVVVVNPAQPSADDIPYYDSIGEGLSLTNPANETTGADSANDSQNRYTLEFDVTSSREDAQALVDHLSVLGVEAYFTPLLQGTKVIYRVRRGIYPTEKIAMDDSIALKNEKKLATKVVLLQ